MSLRKNKLWAFDIDGVVANTFPYFKYYFEKEFKICLFEMPYYPSQYCSNVKMKDFMRIFYNSVVKNYIKPFSEAIETITNYYKNDNPIIFITNRQNLEKETKKWLNKHFYFPYKLYFGTSSFNKLKIAKEIGVTGIIDDKVKICRIFKEEGLDHILHKQGHQLYEDYSGLNRLNWNEIREELC